MDRIQDMQNEQYIPQSSMIEIPNNNIDCNFILSKRLERIDMEMDSFTYIILCFSQAVDYELKNLITNMA